VGKPPRNGFSSKDEQIKVLAQTDRGAACRLLVTSYREWMVYYSWSMVKNQQDAEDIATDAFVRALDQEGFFDPEFKMKAWLYRVVTNLSLNKLRDRKRHNWILEVHGFQLIPSTEHSAQEQLEAYQGAKRVEERLDHLSPLHAEILRLRYWEDLGYEEIKDVLGVSMGTVKSRLNRAQTHLGIILSRKERDLVNAAK